MQRLLLEGDEASVVKPPRRLPSDPFRCLGGGTKTARLRDNRHSTARPQRPARSFSRTSGSGHIPKLLTTSALSNISLKSWTSRADPSRNPTRPCSTSVRLRTAAWRTMTSEWSIPSTKPSGCPAGELTDRESRAEAHLQDVVLRLHIQQSDRPPVVLSVSMGVAPSPSPPAARRSHGVERTGSRRPRPAAASLPRTGYTTSSGHVSALRFSSLTPGCVPALCDHDPDLPARSPARAKSAPRSRCRSLASGRQYSADARPCPAGSPDRARSQPGRHAASRPQSH